MKMYSLTMESSEVKTLAQWLRDKGLVIPAIFLLESFKPLSGIFNAGLDAMALKDSSLISSNMNLSRLASVLSNRESIEDLIVELESASSKETAYGN